MDTKSAEEAYLHILKIIGEDANRQGLKKTPARAARALQHLTHGYDLSPEAVVSDALFDSTLDDMIIVKDIELYSLCEHHMLPFIGKCHVGYLPNGKILGLSKVARIVEVFSRRLQVQERLTHEIGQSLLTITGAHGVGVTIEAKHLCMMMRGVEKQNSSMVTSCMLGSFRTNHDTRHEFLKLISK